MRYVGLDLCSYDLLQLYNTPACGTGLMYCGQSRHAILPTKDPQQLVKEATDKDLIQRLMKARAVNQSVCTDEDLLPYYKGTYKTRRMFVIGQIGLVDPNTQEEKLFPRARDDPLLSVIMDEHPFCRTTTGV